MFHSAPWLDFESLKSRLILYQLLVSSKHPEAFCFPLTYFHVRTSSVIKPKENIPLVTVTPSGHLHENIQILKTFKNILGLVPQEALCLVKTFGAFSKTNFEFI